MHSQRYSQISVVKQYYALASSPICQGRGTLEKGHLVWEFLANPSPLSREYRLRILYKQGRTPSVYVDDPDLTELAQGENIPHVYQQKPTRLCLYLPGTGQWSAGKWIFQTIVPWTLLWLYYFEDWLATGEWKGGGKHPDLTNGKYREDADYRQEHPKTKSRPTGRNR